MKVNVNLKFQMKLALIFLLSAFVVISQQFQYKARPKGLFWLSPYSPTGVNSYQQSVQRFYKDYLHNEVPVPLRSHWKPSTRIGEIVTFFKVLRKFIPNNVIYTDLLWEFSGRGFESGFDLH